MGTAISIQNETVLKVKNEIKAYDRKIAGSYRSNTFSNAMHLRGKLNEAEYLMSGGVTELVESVWIPSVFERDAHARIYGVVAQNRKANRYVWIYLYYRNHIWSCWSIKEAIQLVDKLKEHENLRKGQEVLERKLKREENKLKLIERAN